MNKILKNSLSVCLISYNEEDNLARTLEAIKDIANEIILVDSGSEDTTVEIAKRYGAKVYIEEWKGHIAQKNSALEKCTCEWILCLDCDEVVSEELLESIKPSINDTDTDGYYVHRKTHYLGRLLKYSWQPDKKLRLVKKESNPRWIGLNPHDELKINGTTKSLKGDLIHYSYRNLKDHFDRTISYSKISAQSYLEKGKSFSILNLIFNPIISFIRLYFINFAFMDGIRGLIAGFSTFVYTFLKYAFLFELTLKNKRSSNND